MASLSSPGWMRGLRCLSGGWSCRFNLWVWLCQGCGSRVALPMCDWLPSGIRALFARIVRGHGTIGVRRARWRFRWWWALTVD
eukprot:8088785-Alexandrium_andersonii.AAC.1